MKITLRPIKDVVGTKTKIKTSFMLESMTMGKRDFFFPSPLFLDVEVLTEEDLLYVQGELILEIGFDCSRCLDEMTMNLRIPFMEEFSRDEVLEDTLDITQRVLENILLEIPQKPLCSEDCRGLCPRCGQDQNKGECSCQKESIDPRLAVLDEYFKRE